MTCPPYEELSAYADHMLKPRAQARLAEHVQGCPQCQQQLQALQALQLNLQALPSPTLNFDLGARLNDRLLAGLGRNRAPARPVWARWGGWAPAGLAAAAMAWGVWLGGLLVGGSAISAPRAAMVRVFDPVPPGGLCAVAELCRFSKGMP